MNFKHISLVTLLAIGINTPAQDVFSQGLKGRWGFGFGVGAQQQYSDLAVTPFGFGGEGFLTYRLTEKLSINLAAGYNTLGFKLPGVAKTFVTNLFFGNLYADYEFMQLGRIRPFLMAGFGGMNFQVEQNKRYNDAEALLGGGVRFFVTPNMAVSLFGNAKYTTGDDLDGGQRGGNKINDAYFTARAAVTFYLGGKPSAPEEVLFTKMDTEPVPDESDQPTETDEDLGSFLNKLSTLEDQQQGMVAESGAGETVTVEEYVRLRSRIDELNEAIERKEREIYKLQQEIASRQGTINAIQQTQVPSQTTIRPTSISTTPVRIQDISTAYENALNKFYSRRFSEAISIFSAIIQKYPNHSLASNCQYWIGESYFAAGDYLSAIDAFQKVLNYERTLKRDDALFMLGRAYMELGKNDQAIAMFNRLLTQHPDSEYVDSVRKYLKRL